MNKLNFNLNNFLNLNNIRLPNQFQFIANPILHFNSRFEFYKNGGEIKIKKQNIGSFTKYCNGHVTLKCILKGKHSTNPKIRKKATFAANARKWKHLNGGILQNCLMNKFNLLLKKLNNYV